MNPFFVKVLKSPWIYIPQIQKKVENPVKATLTGYPWNNAMIAQMPYRSTVPIVMKIVGIMNAPCPMAATTINAIVENGAKPQARRTSTASSMSGKNFNGITPTILRSIPAKASFVVEYMVQDNALEASTRSCRCPCLTSSLARWTSSVIEF